MISNLNSNQLAIALITIYFYFTLNLQNAIP